ncbi:MAG: hypothetical protein JSV63_03480 [Candidatus Aenigmatarchaeota archaeon]|nr:MAG: hypothetical protein JSV63_03480 [Candidatus Aenigmarchaeota archaeon]
MTRKKAAKKARTIPTGTIRIKVEDLRPYEKTRTGWKRSRREFPELMHVVELFKAQKDFSALIDARDMNFLKGQLSPDGKTQGARITILPDGRKLDKAYSLFADQLAIHDEASNTHWDVIYRNPGGTYSYVYTLDKKEQSRRKKYREVEHFEQLYPNIDAEVTKALDDRDDDMAIPMYTLLKTYMRVGNEMYYKAHGSKGLTTLKKKDIHIKGSSVTFKYLSKGGVPREFTEEFPENYIKRVKKLMAGKKPEDFVFVNRKTGHPLSDTHFKHAFGRYCDHEFYPHIVRSFYATEKAKEFLSMHDKVTKKELLDFYRFLAAKLGHKRFVKKDHEWKESYSVTIHHYIEPRLLDKLNSLVG